MARTRSLLLVAALAVAALAGAACSVANPSALAVGDTTLSRSSFMSELQALASDAAALQAIFNVSSNATQGAAPGTYNTGFTAAVLQRHVVADLLTDIATELGLEVTDEDLVEAEAFVAQQLPADLGGFEQVIARIVALDRVLAPRIPAEELNELLTEKAQRVSVVVDGQFGRWDAENLQVLPPEGPMLPSSSSSQDQLIEELLSSLQGS